MDEPFPNPAQNRGSPAGAISSVINQAGPGPGLNALFGPSVQGKSNQRIPTSSIKAAVIGIYFSAHWCPPCQAFTPILSIVYQQAQRRGKSFEVIFCSSDREASEFQSYWNIMPWPSLPFENRRQKTFLSHFFSVRSIPHLVLVNNSGAKIPVENTVALIRRNADLFLNQLPDGPVRGAPLCSPVPFLEETRSFVLDSVLDEIEEAEKGGKFSLEEKVTAFKTIVAILSNVTNHPDDPKYRSLKKVNKALQSKLLSTRTECFVHLMKAAGFRESEECYILPESVSPSSSQFEEVKQTVEGLTMSAEDQGEDPSKYVCDGNVCKRKT